SLRRFEASGAVSVQHRHRVTSLIVTAGTVDGVVGEILAPSSAARGEKSTREVIGEFRLRAPAVVVTSGGIGGDHDLVRRYWPERLGTPPAKMLSGVPDHVDGRMLEVARSGAEQNPGLTAKSVLGVVRRAMPRAVKPVERFGERGRDFVFAPNIRELAAKMHGLAGADEIDGVSLEREIAALDEQAASSAPSDAQPAAIREARRHLSDRLIRVARPHPLP